MQQPLESRIARLFSMSDETLEKHANHWSVWTRFAALPVLVAGVWSRVWIGPWGMTISDICLLEKSGGKSGLFVKNVGE